VVYKKMGIKTIFSIKDLENLSGIKAHTIRIWEKRYRMFSPERTDTNIRYYDLEDLTKLLNINVLQDNGKKISHIAELSSSEMQFLVRELSIKKKDPYSALQNFKLSMLQFDQKQFENTYNQLLTEYSFRDIFYNVFLVLLEEIGILWQTASITPAHEHFISTLIQQKILYNIEKVQNSKIESDKVFVLFLPQNELHELGLLYVHFELLLKGYKSIYLGAGVPTESLWDLRKNFSNILYVSYFTVDPEQENALNYIQDFQDSLLSDTTDSLHILGRNSRHLIDKKLPKNTFVHKDIKSFVESL
jgi:DNA-binding transcriptional MerR regulator